MKIMIRPHSRMLPDMVDFKTSLFAQCSKNITPRYRLILKTISPREDLFHLRKLLNKTRKQSLDNEPNESEFNEEINTTRIPVPVRQDTTAIRAEGSRDF